MQTSDQISAIVNAAYSAKAITNADSDSVEYFRKVSLAFGYTAKDLELLDGANMGLGCGNPTAIANIRLGEHVLDLGCGGGMDVILAASKVGPSGKVWGVDMNADMIKRCRENIRSRGLVNVDLVQTSITDLTSIGTGTVDCIISNCVINLVPDDQKQLVVREAFRILKPGGRLAISDIVLKKAMPPAIREDAISYVGCISGATEVNVYKSMLAQEGFQDVVFLSTGSDLSIYRTAVKSSCCGSSPAVTSGQGGLNPAFGTYDVNEYAGESTQFWKENQINSMNDKNPGSCQIFAVKS